MKVDLVQLGILLVIGLTMIAGLWSYSVSVFASKESVEALATQVNAIYNKIIPEAERH